MKLSVILPVYNEAGTVRSLLDKVIGVDLSQLNIEKEVIIIESNSTDGTREIIQEYEKKQGIRAIYQKRPKGKGSAVRLGFKHASGDIFLIQDGDLEYDPDEYPKLIKPIIDGHADFVLGSRQLGKDNDWKIRSSKKEAVYFKLLNFGGLFYTSLFNLLYNTKLTDPATMYKVFKPQYIQNTRFRTNGFDFDWELVARLIQNKARVIEVPITYESRLVQEGKKIRFFRDGIKVFLAILRFRFT
ncbi:MAG: glycosyltransferase family 2 protein [Candidatus Woesearchaeota archaeon]